MINIKTLKEKQNFTFKDSMDNSYEFGFEIELTFEKDISLNISFIVVTVILSAVIVLLIILYCKLKKKQNLNNYRQESDFFG